MARPNRLKELEQEWGEPLETLIPRLLNEHQTITATAPVLPVSFGTLLKWCEENVEKEHVWRLKGDNRVPA